VKPHNLPAPLVKTNDVMPVGILSFEEKQT